MSWAALFERAAEADASVDDVSRALARRRREREDRADAHQDPDADREGDADPLTGRDSAVGATADPTADRWTEPSPARVVADADVLAADLLVGGAAREALDAVRAHSWVRLVASDALLDDAAAVVADLAGTDLAGDWRAAVEPLRTPVAHPPGDHPALASAARGSAMHVLSVDDALLSAGAAAAIRDRVETSVKSPRAFAGLFDPASLYAAVEGGEYPGPDRDPRG